MSEKDKIAEKVLQKMFPKESIPVIDDDLAKKLDGMTYKLDYQAEFGAEEFYVKRDKKSMDALDEIKKIGIAMTRLFYKVGKMGKYDFRVEILDKTIAKYRDYFKGKEPLKLYFYLGEYNIRFYLSSCMIAGVIKGRDGKDNTDVIINSSRILKENVK